MKNLFLIVIVFLIFGQTIAQDTLTRKETRKLKSNFILNEKKWSLELPIWVPGFAGYFSYGDVSVEGDDGQNPVNPIEPPDNIFDGILSRLFKANWFLRFLYLTKVSYENNRFLAVFDAMTINIGSSIKFRSNENSLVDAKFGVSYGRLIGGFEFYEYNKVNRFRYELFGYIGARIYYHSIATNINNTGVEINISPLKMSPVIGIYNQFTFKRWQIILQGDLGSTFDKNNHSTQISLWTYYQIGKLNSLKLGWNHLYYKTKGKFLRDDYQINATFSGPTIGLAFHF